MKKLFPLLLCTAMLTGCASNTTADSTPESTTTKDVSVQPTTAISSLIPLSSTLTSFVQEELFTGSDYEVGLVFDTEQSIVLKGTSSVTITEAGSYRVTGSLTDGQLVIDTEDKVQLILDGVSITNATSAAIYASNCDKLFITLEGDNQLTSTIVDTEDSNVDAALFAKGDLTLNGTGSLTVTTTNGNGITSKDDLVFTGGDYKITADGHGLDANNSIRIADGTFVLDTGKDGLHADDDDVEKGYIYIADGTFIITAMGDGMDSSSQIQIDDGDFTITTGGGSALNEYSGSNQAMGGGMNHTQQAGGMPEFGSQTTLPEGEMPPMTDRGNRTEGQMPLNTQMQGEMPADTQMRPDMMGGQGQMNGGQMQGQMGGQIEMQPQLEATQTEDTTPSTKGIKATTNLIIAGGNFTLDCYEDGLHSNGNVWIGGGIFTIAAGDDGIHGDWNTTVAGGNIIITTCYEGLEGQQVEVLDGTISIYALDDGINATRSETASDSDIYIRIAGGTIDMDTYFAGDGVDSNGDIEMTGGTLRISGTTVTTDTPLDYSGDSFITGGTFLVAGSASRTSQNFGESSTQAAIWVQLDAVQSGTYTLTDSTGNVVAEYTPTKEYQTIGISNSDIQVGETYTLTAGTETLTIVMDSLLYGEGNEGSMMGGGQMGGMTGGQMGGKR